MRRTEFDRYYWLASSDDTKRIMLGDIPDPVEDIRSKAAIIIARVGHEFSRLKNIEDEIYLCLRGEIKGNGKSCYPIEDARRLSRVRTCKESEVRAKELEWLLEALKQLCNACASKLRKFEGPKK